MRPVTLKRITSGLQGTFGVLLVGGLPFCVTLEDPDNDNQRNISCIPAGKYRCSPYPSQKFGNTFVVEGVRGRAGILFHAGNTHLNTHGCILLGERFGTMSDGTPAILDSVSAVKRFLREFSSPFELEVVNCF